MQRDVVFPPGNQPVELYGDRRAGGTAAQQMLGAVDF